MTMYCKLFLQANKKIFKKLLLLLLIWSRLATKNIRSTKSKYNNSKFIVWKYRKVQVSGSKVSKYNDIREEINLIINMRTWENFIAPTAFQETEN